MTTFISENLIHFYGAFLCLLTIGLGFAYRGLLRRDRIMRGGK